MSGFLSPFWQLIASVITGLVALIIGFFVLPKFWGRVVRYRWRLAGLLAVALAVLFLFVLPRRFPPSGFGDSALPQFFRPAYWAWLLLFVMLAGGSALSLVERLVLRPRSTERAEAPGVPAAGDADLDAAWNEIAVRLDHNRIDLGSQKVYLLLTPSEEFSDALVQSAGLQVFAKAPERPAPIHAYAVSDGVLLSCAGVSAFGTGDEAAARRLAEVCRRLLAVAPDCPVVRGVAVLFPISWASSADSIRAAATVRADLHAIRNVLQVRCPVFALFPGMETVPGFLEFMSRLSGQVSPRMLEQRIGFAVPSSHAFSGELVQRGLAWLSSWMYSWVLNLISGDLLNHHGNSELVALDQEIRRYRKRLRAITESAFATHRDSDPVLFRGCYFVATGADRRDQGFSAGLLRGARSRVFAEHVGTRWAAEADAGDRRYRRIALIVGLAGGLPSLLAWANIISRTAWGWVGLLAIVAAWAVTLLRLRTR